MTYSLRRVLAVRFSLTMFVALAFIALWAVLGVRRTLRSQSDAALRSTLELQNLRLAAGGAISQQPSHFDFQRFFEEGSRVVLVRNVGGAVVQATVSDMADFPLDTAALMEALNDRTAWTNQTWRGSPVRSVYAPTPAGSAPGMRVLQVATSLMPLGNATRDMLFAMLGTVVLATIVVGFGSYWLASSAVRPVHEVSEQARAISPGGAVKQITTHADVAEYQSLIETLNNLLARCDEAFQSQRRLTADIGHELRTPLTALRGEMEIALRSERSPRDYQLVLRSGLEEIDRLTRMCDALLLIREVESRSLPVQRAPTDINELFLKSVYRQRKDFERRETTLHTRFDYRGAPPMLDANLTAKLLDELIENAIEHAGANGTVTLGTASDGRALSLTVEDSGPGIAPEHLPHLFDPFYRADEARTRGASMGLGLTIAVRIAEVMGGTITAENAVKSGARFEVKLPLITQAEGSGSVRAA